MPDGLESSVPDASKDATAGVPAGSISDGPNVTKPLGMKIVELRDAIMLIGDCAKRIREGKRYYVLALASQLRGLLADQSKGSERLLIEVAEKLNFNLELYCMDDAVEMAEMMPVKDSLVFTVAGFPVSVEREADGQKKVTLEEFLNLKIIKLRDSVYTIANVIKWYADKGGGTHYSKKIPKDFIEILNMGRQTPINFDGIFVQIGEAVAILGQRLLAKLIDQELHFVMQLTELPKSDMHIMDALHGPTGIRTVFFVTERGGAAIIFVGMNNERIWVREDWKINWNRIRHIHIGLSVNDDLHTTIEIFIDGKRIFHRKWDFCLITMCPQDDFDVIYNKKHEEGAAQSFEFFLSGMMFYSAELSPYERARNLLYLDRVRSDPDGNGMLVPAGTYMRSEPGNHDLVFEGDVRFVNFRDLKPGPSFEQKQADS
jgi:hypothetical protein